MTDAGTCEIAFAGTRLVVAWEGRASFALLNALHPLTPGSERRGVIPQYRFRAEPGGRLRLVRGDELVYEGRSKGGAAVALLDRIAYDLADRCLAAPMFHAAAVHYRGYGVLMPGTSGAGKTTLVAWLASQGWDYLTDELACVDLRSHNLAALCRALHFKEPTASSIAPLIDPASGSDGIYRYPNGSVVPVARIRPANEYRCPRVRLILFPRYVPDADQDVVRFSPARAGARLMACALNIRNLPGHAFYEISQLARRIPSYSLTYGRLDDLAGRIAALLDCEV